MTFTSENEKTPSSGQDNIDFVPDSPEIPESIEKGGVTAVPTQFTAQVNDQNGQPLIQSSQTAVKITLPNDQLTLNSQSRGSASLAVTWLANFWLRMIKKARHFGWGVAVRQ